MTVEILQVDAFARGPFTGNPAAVCFPSGDAAGPDEAWMRSVAAEMNLSETAFVQPREDGFSLRWFTPTTEVPLCGHATLASAWALWETGRATGTIRFHTRSGPLSAWREGEEVTIDLPAQPLAAAELPAAAREALGVEPLSVQRTPDRGLGDRDYLVELRDESDVRELAPAFDRLRGVAAGIIVTAKASGEEHDYVCRYFAPFWGIDEDPVTGAAHCALVPFWSDRLGVTALTGLQASSRSGVVRSRLAGDRVHLSGRAVTVLRGQLLA